MKMSPKFNKKTISVVLLVLILLNVVYLLLHRFESNLGSYSISYGNGLNVQVKIEGLYKESNANIIVVKDNEISKYSLENGNNGSEYSKNINIEDNDFNETEILVEWTANNKRHIEYLKEKTDNKND